MLILWDFIHEEWAQTGGIAPRTPLHGFTKQVFQNRGKLALRNSGSSEKKKQNTRKTAQNTKKIHKKKKNRNRTNNNTKKMKKMKK